MNYYKNQKGIAVIYIILIVVLVIFVVAFGGWYFYQQQPKSTDDVVTTTKATATTTTTIVPGVTYEDERFNFRLTFPDTWKNYGVSYDTDDEVTHTAIHFGLPSTPNTYADFGFQRHYTDIFAVSIYSEGEWAKIQDQEMKPNLLKKSGSVIYAWEMGNGVPENKDVASDQVPKDVKLIIESFELIK